MDGVLCRLYPPGEDETTARPQQIIPKSLQDKVLQMLHEGLGGGHLGTEKMLLRLKERFYWPGHYTDVTDWCRSCSPCSSRKGPTTNRRAPLQNIKAGYPLQMIATDIMGPFPKSATGNTHILVVSDYFTRWAEAYAIPNLEAATIAKKLTKEFILRFGPPEQLHSDQGRNFESRVITELCKLLGIAKTRTTPYHPQSDGLVERLNRTLLNMLSTAVTDQQEAWEDHLQSMCMAYNTSVQSTTGYTPFFLMFGRQARLPVDLMYGSNVPTPKPLTEYAQHLKQTLETSYQSARETMGCNLQRQKDLYDQRIHGRPHKPGDLVWLHCPAVPRGCSKKLYRPWKGPYKVIRTIGKTTYHIKNLHCPRKKLYVHFNRLKPYSGRDRDSTNLTQSAPDKPMDPSQDSQPPLGSHLTLLEPEIDMDMADAASPPAHPPIPRDPQATRYPQRNRRPPDYYHNQI